MVAAFFAVATELRKLRSPVLLTVVASTLGACDGGCSSSGPSTAPSSQAPLPDAAATTEVPSLTLGPVAGDVTPTGLTLWARASEAAEVFARIEGAGAAKTKAAEAMADRDFTVTVPFDGLQPATDYTYAMWTGAESDEPPSDALRGTIRTAPPPDAPAAVALAWSGDLGGQNFCRDRHEDYVIFEALNREKLDAFIGLGDMIYADGKCEAVGRYGNLQRPARFAPAGSLPEFWAHYRYNWADPGFRELAAKTAYLPIWDDHEIENDSGPKSAAFSAARSAFLHYAPFQPPESDPARLYRRARYGKHVELFFLDTRQHRTAQDAKDGADKTLLGAPQREWLTQGVASSDATWKIIVSSVPIAIPTGDGPDARDGWASHGGETGYERELTAIFEALQSANARTLWLTTDVHFATGFRYQPFGAFELHEIVVGPMAAGIYPKDDLDETFHPARLFKHAPNTPEAVNGYEDAKQWLTYGLVSVSAEGRLDITVKTSLGDTVFAKTLTP